MAILAALRHEAAMRLHSHFCPYCVSSPCRCLPLLLAAHSRDHAPRSCMLLTTCCAMQPQGVRAASQQTQAHQPSLSVSSLCVHRTMAAHGSYGARFMELLARAGPQIEPAADGWSHSPDLSFWVATLLPLTLSQRLEFSSMTSTSARLQVHILTQMYTCVPYHGCSSWSGSGLIQPLGEHQSDLQEEHV